MPAAADDDYYKILGVSRGASSDEIRKAHRKLSRQYHPDKNPGDTAAAERFKKIQEAYEILSDPEKREQFDRYGAAFKGGGQWGQGPFQWKTKWSTRGAPGGTSAEFDLNDILGGMFGGMGGQAGFGGGRGGPRPMRGQDVALDIQVPFQTAAEGGNHSLALEREGRTERINVKIPAGIDDGKTIRLAGQGQPGPGGGPAGDLLLTIRVAPHPWFRREGSDLYVDVPITPSEAVLGAKVEAPTLGEGNVTVTVPPASSSGRKLRLRGKGVTDAKTGQRGDQFVVIKIVVPAQADDETQRLYRELAARSPENPRAGLW
ncbi:MAG: J domain-containing protein [Planctomycetes bacterium]|nr:J domain-containing protein [Planctomycetota bacterium]